MTLGTVVVEACAGQEMAASTIEEEMAGLGGGEARVLDLEGCHLATAAA